MQILRRKGKSLENFGAAGSLPTGADGGLRESESGENAFHDLPIDVGEAEVAASIAIGELFVINTKEVQDGGMKVMHMDFLLHGVHAYFISGAIGETSAHPTTGEKGAEGRMMVVPAFFCRVLVFVVL